MTVPIEYSDFYGRRIRKEDDYHDQKVSTYRRVHEAIDEGEMDIAAELVDMSLTEAAVIHDVLNQWEADLKRILKDKGVSMEDIKKREDFVISLSQFPDGDSYSVSKGWTRVRQSVLAVLKMIYQGEWDQAHVKIDEAREIWRQHHDRLADIINGLMSLLVEECGEEIVPEMYEEIGGPLFNWRYAKYDVSHYSWKDVSLPSLMYLTLESMRSHLSTEHRDGADLDIVEHDNRWELTFDPCGSGGRVQRGDTIEGTPSRLKPPYNFKVIEDAHDWTDDKKGVCIYCNHCQVMLEHWPMDRFGYPVRVIEPPQYPTRNGVAIDDTGPNRQKCKWTMYKDLADTPAEVYERCGRKKPEKLGSQFHTAKSGPKTTGSFGGNG